MCGGENLFGPITLFESFDLPSQDNGQAKIPLPSFVNQLTALQNTSFAQWFQQRELLIIQLREGDAFRVAIKLFVLLFVGRHFRTLCADTENENRGREKREKKLHTFGMLFQVAVSACCSRHH
jgi:hypothetical protein